MGDSAVFNFRETVVMVFRMRNKLRDFRRSSINFMGLLLFVGGVGGDCGVLGTQTVS